MALLPEVLEARRAGMTAAQTSTHRWETREWPDRERTCRRCGVRARRYGNGRDSYWGYLWPDAETESFDTRVPACLSREEP